MALYAVTPTSYRTISSESDAVSGETVVTSIPQSTMTAILENDLREKRDRMLSACDWTQAADSPLSSTLKQSWATYRQELRQVPQQTGFPNNITWPTMP